MLDDVASIDDAARALLQDGLGAAQQFVVLDPSTASHEHRHVSRSLDDLVVVLEIRRRVGLDQVGAELTGLAYQGDDLRRGPVDLVPACHGVVLHDERLDHQGHAVGRRPGAAP